MLGHILRLEVVPDRRFNLLYLERVVSLYCSLHMYRGNYKNTLFTSLFICYRRSGVSLMLISD